MPANGGYFVYVGCYTKNGRRGHGNAEGISVCRLNPETSALDLVGVATEPINPSFLTLHPNKRFLYSVNETHETDGQIGGAVCAFAVDQSTGMLTYLNKQSSRGVGPCHVSVEHTGRFALVANYQSGSVAMLPIQSDGSLGPASDFHQHAGSSVNPQRQEGPHAHSINVDPSNRYALVPDLGMDKVMVYRLDLDNGKLVPNDVPWATLAPGSGPRHLDFHPNHRWVYVINEIASTVTVFEYVGSLGTLREIQTVPTLPSDFSGSSTCADVHVHPSGKFVYGSNRGHDSIAIFAIDEATGRMTSLGHEPTGGKTPRNFALNSEGTFLWAANQGTDNIVHYRIDQTSGKLTPTGQITASPTPVCLKIVRL
ncbi:MAG TPA: lactonase family protein [Chloroflexota bacterium]|nr:lactonase family protein [Chloroflexota bacterium]